MRFSRRFHEEESILPIVPMMNILFLLMMFFLLAQVYGAWESDVRVALPAASDAPPADRRPGEIIINIRADGAIVVNDHLMEMDGLQQVLQRAVHYFPEGAAVIRGDKSVNFNRVLMVMECCRKANIQHVAFAVQPEKATP